MTTRIAIVGTNASGKSDLGLRVAEYLGTSILSADSRQVYRGFDLCSGKVPVADRRGVPHHLIDVVSAPTVFTLHDYLGLARPLLLNAEIAGIVPPVVVGGTPLYAEALVRDYDLKGPPPDWRRRQQLESLPAHELASRLEVLFPGESARIGATNVRRLARAIERAEHGLSYDDTHQVNMDTKWLVLGVTWEMQELEVRIRQRLVDRLNGGMVDEIEDALAQGVPREFLWSLGLEYRYILRRLDGEYGSELEFVDDLARGIRRFAKRQLSWFRRWSDIQWLEGSEDKRLDQALAVVDSR